ncbi:hypothetical protein MOP88_01180 [Sphingomonas sp. WKB10]|nr:hypothetical protein [Sphingomonas sp. WKB10]
MSFDAALARIDDASPGLSGEDHAVRASELIAGATRSLRRPVVSASASVIEYQKTLSVDLTGPKDNAANATTDFLSQLPGQFPVGLQQIVGQVTQRVGAALPTIFGAIPDTLQYQTRDTVFRPAVTAAMPLTRAERSRRSRQARTPRSMWRAPGRPVGATCPVSALFEAISDSRSLHN